MLHLCTTHSCTSLLSYIIDNDVAEQRNLSSLRSLSILIPITIFPLLVPLFSAKKLFLSSKHRYLSLIAIGIRSKFSLLLLYDSLCCYVIVIVIVIIIGINILLLLLLTIIIVMVVFLVARIGTVIIIVMR